MTFASPDLLTLAPLVALVLALTVTARWRRVRTLGGVYGDPAASRLLPLRPDRFPTGRLLCLVGAGLAIGLAAAGPSPATPQPEEAPAPLDIAVAVDVSLSMIASDAGPSRIERAREVIVRFSEEFPSARIVLVVFAGWPYTLVPPTDDPAVVRYFAESLGADLLQTRDQGTSLSATISHARTSLDGRGRSGARQLIVVLSDGDVHENATDVLRAVSEVAQDGVQVWTAGIGTARGTELVVGTEPVVDPRGAPVVTTLDDAFLRTVATAGGGRYEDVTDDRGLQALLSGLQALGGASTNEDGGPVDATFWLTLLAVPLLLWEGALDAGKSRADGRARRDAA